MREVTVLGLRVDTPGNSPVLILQEVDGRRLLPIWIGAVEATAIALVQQGLTPDRPLTHDLLAHVISATGHELAGVTITALSGGTFFAELEFTIGLKISARPSDAVALALRVGCPILCAEDVLADAAVDATAMRDELDGGAAPDEAEMEEFREFLDHVTPEDFGEGPDSSP